MGESSTIEDDDKKTGAHLPQLRRILAVCSHSTYAEFKRCQESLKALCDECASWDR